MYGATADVSGAAGTCLNLSLPSDILIRSSLSCRIIRAMTFGYVTSACTEDQADKQAFYKYMDAGHIQVYMKSLLQALKDIHQRGIVHRDVKPANFLFDYESCTGVLCDFGLAEVSSSNRAHAICQADILALRSSPQSDVSARPSYTHFPPWQTPKDTRVEGCRAGGLRCKDSGEGGRRTGRVPA
jgi:serine/threonine protein kinase